MAYCYGNAGRPRARAFRPGDDRADWMRCAAQISADYRDRELTVIAILNGSAHVHGRFVAAHSPAAAPRLLERGQLPWRIANQRRSNLPANCAAGRGRPAHLACSTTFSTAEPTINAIREKLADRVAAKYPCLRLTSENKSAGPANGSGLRRIRYRRRICASAMDSIIARRYRNLPCIGVLKELVTSMKVRARNFIRG